MTPKQARPRQHRVMILMPAEMAEGVFSLAAERDEPAAEIVRRCVEAYLPTLRRQTPAELEARATASARAEAARDHLADTRNTRRKVAR